MKKILLTTICSLTFLAKGFGQGIPNQDLPVMELGHDAIFPSVGPYDSSLLANFYIDYNFDTGNNLDSTFLLTAINPLSIQLSFKNQTFTNLPYSNIKTGLTFGGGATLSTGGVTQQSATNVPYNLMGYYSSNGGPKSFMFTSNPFPIASEVGTGFDVDGDLFGGRQTGAFQLFTSAQVLFDQNYGKTDRVYFGDLVMHFSQPVLNPVVHFAGMGGSYSFLPYGKVDSAYNYKTTFFATELELQNQGLTSTKLSGNQYLNVAGNNILNSAQKPNGNSFQISGEYPIDNYGAATGSIRLNGLVQDVVYKVYLRGADSSVISWSTLGLDPATSAQLVTGATRNPFTGDIWWVSASLIKPTQQLSGKVFVDQDALINNNIATTGLSNATENPKTNVGDSLYAILVNNVTNTIVSSMKVNKDGLYMFDSIAAGDYYVQLNSVPGVVGQVPPVVVMPDGWINTGERNGLTPGSDGSVNSTSSVVTVPVGEVVTDVNFGIQSVPNSDPKSHQIAYPTGGVIPQGTATNNVSGSDKQDGIYGNSRIFEVTKLPTNATLYYNGVLVTVGTQINGFSPSLLSYTSITNGSTTVVFEYAYLDSALAKDPTPATYELFWTVPFAINSVTLQGHIIEKSNELMWNIVGTLPDIKGIHLHRKVNGGKDEVIASLAVKGNDYTYSDANLVIGNAEYKYHVVVVEKNNKEYLSNVAILRRMHTNGVSVFPNPVVSDFTVYFDTETSSESKVKIQDVNGKLIRIVEVPAGSTSTLINLADVASGVYNVVVINEELGTKTLQIIKK